MSAKKRDELLNQDHVRAMVAEHAYYISESEGFPQGRELDHWVRAEEHVVTVLSKPEAKAVVQTDGAAKKPAAKKPAVAATKSAAKPAAKAPAKKK